MSTVKRLALSIVQFLAEQKQYGAMSPDAQVMLFLVHRRCFIAVTSNCLTGKPRSSSAMP